MARDEWRERAVRLRQLPIVAQDSHPSPDAQLHQLQLEGGKEAGSY